MLRRGGRRPRALSSSTITELAGTTVTLPENFTTYTIDQGDAAIVHTGSDGQGISFVEQYIDGPTVETVSAHSVVDDGQTALVQAGGHYVEAILEDNDGDVRVIQLQEVMEGLSQPTTRGRGRGRGRGGISGIKRAALAPVASVLMGGPPKRRRPGRRPITELQAEDENSLCYIIREQKATVQQVVEGWVQSYWLSRDGALLSLTQFFFNASGCKGKITSNMQATMEYTEIITKMAEEFDDQMGSEYPLVLTGPQWKKFKENIAEFIQRLIKHGHKERPPLGVMPMLHDQCLMDNLVSFLTALSDSSVRAFRHTATFAGIKMMTALVEVIQLVISSMEGLRRHAGLLKGYRSGGGGMTAKRQEMEDSLEELKNMLSYTFKSIFAVRYRDTLPEIRSICMAEMGHWMSKYPGHFLTDSYLKYIGWSLNDRVGAVRLNCLQALQPLYDSELHRGKLELFTSKFKSRIVGMRADKEYEVAVEAVKLVTSILKYQPEALTPSDCEQIYELLYEVHRGVALAAGEFLQHKLFVPKSNGIKKAANSELICDLVIFFTAHRLHEHGLYLVDSLIDTTPILKDWESMIKLLLHEEDVDADGGVTESGPLNENQQIALVEIMTCSIRQAATGEPPLCRGTTRKVMTTSELKQVSDDRAVLSEHLLKALPQLLTKFMQHPDAVKNLMAIPQYCDLQLYSLNSMEEELDDLLQLICQAMENHSDREVLKMSVKTLERLCEMGSQRFPKCEAVRTVLIDSIVTQFKAAMQHHTACSKEGEIPEVTELLELTEVTHKLAVLYGCHDVGPWGVWDYVYEIVQNLNSEQLPDEVLKHCMTIAYFSIFWDFACFMENDFQSDVPTAINGRDPTHLELLRTRVISFVCILRTAIQECPVQVLREEAFILLCDLLIHLRNGDHGSGPSHCRWGVLPSYQVDDELQDLLNDFVQREVFTDCEMSCISVENDEDEQKKYELHRRRCFLASFCKLIVYNVMPITVASNIFKHYLKFGEKYGDIIKATLSKARDINKVECARTMVLSLMTLFTEMCDKSDMHMREDNSDVHEDRCVAEDRCSTHIVDRQSEEFLSLKEMAKRFALSFGLDSVKNREAVTALHRDGILFAVQPLDDPLGVSGPPPYLPFLEILAEFTFKLLNQDKRVVLSYLDQRIATGMASGSGEDWRPLLLYRNSLVHGESTSATPIMPIPTPATNNSSPESDSASKSLSRLNPKRTRNHSHVEEDEDDVEAILPSKLQMEEVVVEPSTEFFTGPTVQLSLPFNQTDYHEETLPSSSSKTRRLNVVSYLHRNTVGYPRSWIPAVSILPGYNEASSSRTAVRQKREKSAATGSG